MDKECKSTSKIIRRRRVESISSEHNAVSLKNPQLVKKKKKKKKNVDEECKSTSKILKRKRVESISSEHNAVSLNNPQLVKKKKKKKKKSTEQKGEGKKSSLKVDFNSDCSDSDISFADSCSDEESLRNEVDIFLKKYNFESFNKPKEEHQSVVGDSPVDLKSKISKLNKKKELTKSTKHDDELRVNTKNVTEKNTKTAKHNKNTLEIDDVITWKEKSPQCKKPAKVLKGISSADGSIKYGFDIAKLRKQLGKKAILTAEETDGNGKTVGVKLKNKQKEGIDGVSPKGKKKKENKELSHDEELENKSDIKSDTVLWKEKLNLQMKSAAFRLVNEQMYTASGSDSFDMFKKDPEAFKVYHEGYASQVKLWPLHPLKLIQRWLVKKPRTWVIADFGCGEAQLSKMIPNKVVHSLDLVASNPRVTVCDMANTPLKSGSVDVAIFCLSLMGTSISQFILEANRVLKVGGFLKIAEVESRFDKPQHFIRAVEKFGFHSSFKNMNNKFFWLFDFVKDKDASPKATLAEINLKPCIYKRR